MINLLFAALFYSALMIVIRLKIMETAYQFEEAKAEERSLREEQQRLRVKISERLAPGRLKAVGFQEPEPSQIVLIPRIREEGQAR